MLLGLLEMSLCLISSILLNGGAVGSVYKVYLEGEDDEAAGSSH
jgi:hypothetical protein